MTRIKCTPIPFSFGNVHLMKLITCLILLLISFTSHAEPQIDENDGTFPTYETTGRLTIPREEKLLNFGAVYLAQWAFYLYSQNDVIKEFGSFKNWTTNPWRPHFDKDRFEYNVFKHTFVGNYYYLFYRSRDYTEKEAFLWTFASSLAFEFTIETVTERPSYQDIYQTPVFGTVIGIGFEKISDYFHSWDNWYGNFLGYAFNPMILIPQFARKDVVAMPIINKDTTGVAVTYRF